MKYLKKKQMRVICESDPAKFQDRFNELMTQLADQGEMPELIFPQNAVGMVYAVYTEEKQIPECLEEEFQIRGIRHKCNECPHFGNIKSPDRRVKSYYCDIGKCQAYKDRGACDIFLGTMKDENGNYR